MVPIDKRLAATAAFVPRGSVPLDIGTDHGRLPVYLVSKGICRKAIASDISAPSLDKAKSLVRKCNLTGRVETRLGSGLSVVNENEADTLIITGMGGNELISILEAGRERWKEFHTFIFQPMSSQAEFREYLPGSGLRIIDEEIAFDNGRYYEVILVRHGVQRPLSAMECIVGPILAQKQGNHFQGYLQRKIKGVKRALEGVLASNDPGTRARGEYYERLLQEMGELEKCHANAKTS